MHRSFKFNHNLVLVDVVHEFIRRNDVIIYWNYKTLYFRSFGVIFKHTYLRHPLKGASFGVTVFGLKYFIGSSSFQVCVFSLNLKTSVLHFEDYFRKLRYLLSELCLIGKHFHGLELLTVQLVASITPKIRHADDQVNDSWLQSVHRANPIF